MTPPTGSSTTLHIDPLQNLNRSMFENTDVAALTFDEQRSAAAAWAAEAYAPLVTGGPLLEKVRARLGATPVLEIAIDAAGRHSVTVPPGAGLVRLTMQAGRAAEDARPLGAAIALVTVDGAAVELGGPVFGAGFHPAEAGWIWTSGDAMLDLGSCVGVPTVVLEVVAVAALVLAA